ncbi:hypothetical protein RCG23_00900 [Neobacillus sp. PS3-34]|uniref:hypothetical protein n=1 Tax=Neobacillus sp. PS3-34 TaxID=3070678 RepID=UPI0027E0F3DA|nr:hypothetical protein [Neobacillus sp. PS3-34]WML48737.1 hypothetical protein RCG23_00900 [Neobacillus sp. PS3-34]
MKLNKFIPAAVLLLALAGCGGKEAEDSSKKQSKESTPASTNVTKKTETKAPAKPQPAKVVKEEEAAYIGQEDPSSIQVQTKTDTLSLQVADVQNVDWNSIEKDTPVSIKYYKDENGQFVLTGIVVKTDTKAKVIKEDAEYVGQLDPNSIEVNTKTDKLILQVDKVQNVDWNSIEPNAAIEIEYYQNKDGQYILQSIEKK